MNVGSLFSGIGGLDLGLERAGMHVKWQAESDEFCRSVLARHWPHVRCYEDVRAVDSSAERVDIVAGGFPCQPVSLVGRRQAQADERWLWPEFRRVVGDLRPRYVLVENVRGLASKGLSDVVGDLSKLGYDAEWDVVSAASVGAPHIRERIFLVAYASGERRQQVAGGTHGDEGQDEGWPAQDDHFTERDGEGDRAAAVPGALADANGQPMEWASVARAQFDSWASEPALGRVVDGVPHRVVRPQLRALGNAVVPQVAEAIGRAILAGSSVTL